LRLREWLIVAAVAGLAVWGYTWHIESMGRLEGEIKARGESIKQLGELAAVKQKAYARARKAYEITPTLESCTVALSSCEQIHEADSSRIMLLTQQIEAQAKLRSKSKLFGLLPRPVVTVGVSWCPPLARPACLNAGFPITH
jgi:hypothetical protein